MNYFISAIVVVLNGGFKGAVSNYSTRVARVSMFVHSTKQTRMGVFYKLVLDMMWFLQMITTSATCASMKVSVLNVIFNWTTKFFELHRKNWNYTSNKAFRFHRGSRIRLMNDANERNLFKRQERLKSKIDTRVGGKYLYLSTPVSVLDVLCVNNVNYMYLNLST